MNCLIAHIATLQQDIESPCPQVLMLQILTASKLAKPTRKKARSSADAAWQLIARGHFDLIKNVFLCFLPCFCTREFHLGNSWVVIKSCIEILTTSSHFQELSSQKSISDSDYRPLSNKPQDIDSETYTNNMGMGWKVHCNLTIQ